MSVNISGKRSQFQRKEGGWKVERPEAKSDGAAGNSLTNVSHA
jgi:hypothetical protein